MVKEKSKPVEREYTVPLREKCRPVPRYKKTPKAVKSLKEFIAKNMQVRDRDLNKIKIDSYLNEQLWARGIKKPLHKVRVRALKEGDIVRVYSAELPAKINFKKLREEKQETQAKAAAVKQKSLMEKAKEQMQGGAQNTKTKKEEVKETPEEEIKKDEKKKVPKEEVAEKKASVEEVAKETAKEEHKEAKHTTETKETGQPKEQVSEK